MLSAFIARFASTTYDFTQKLQKWTIKWKSENKYNNVTVRETSLGILKNSPIWQVQINNHTSV